MLIILRSTSLMGKSYLASHYDESCVISSDKIRKEMIGTYDAAPHTHAFVWNEINRRIDFRMKERMVTILDATNLSLKTVNKYKKLAKEYDVSVKIASIIPDEGLIHYRMQKRFDGTSEGPLVGHDVVDAQVEKYFKETDKIKKVYTHDFFEGSWDDCKFFIDTMIDQNNSHVVYGETFVIGDIHGCHDELKELLSLIPTNANIYSTGDIIDRGPDSMGCLFTLMNDARFRGFTMGNHEAAFLKELNGKPCNSIPRKRTHEEFQSLLESEKERILKFINTGKSYLIIENPDVRERVLLTHAGVGSLDPVNASVFQTASDNINPVGEENEVEGVEAQIHGHMHWKYTGDSSGTVINNDSGVCYGQYLTAINVFNRDESIKVKAHVVQ